MAENQNTSKHFAFCDLLDDAVVVVGKDSSVVFWNKVAQKLFATAAEKAIGKPVDKLICFEKPSFSWKKELSSIQSQGPQKGQASIISDTGKSIWLAWTLKTFDLPELKLSGSIFIAKDFTKHKQATESQVSYKSLLENLPQRIFVKDTNSTYISCNHNFAQDIGIQAGQIAGKTDFDFFPKNFAEKYRADDKRIMEAGKIVSLEEKYIQNDQEIYIQTVKVPLKNENGESSGIQGILWDISKRKQNEKELLESQNFLKSITETTPDIIYLFDLNEGRNVYSSRETLNVLGYTPKQIQEMGDKLFELTSHPDDIEKVTEHHKKMATVKSEVLELDYRLKDAKGQWHWLRSKDKAFLRNEDGTVKQIIGIAQDITDRKIAEQDLRESEEKYRSLFENMLNGFAYHKIITDDQGNPIDYMFLEVNDAFENLTGLKRENIINKLVTKSLPGIEKDPAAWIGQYGKVALSGGELRFENYSKALDRWFSVYAFQPIPNHFVTIFEDITDRKQTEEALRESEEKFRAISSSALDAVVLMDENGSVVYWNQAAERMFGYSSDEIVGKSVHEFLMPDQYRDLFAKSLIKFQKTGKSSGQGNVLEVMAKRKDGSTFPIEIAVAPIHKKDKYWASAIIRDITDRKKSEEEIRKNRERYKLINDSSIDFIFSYDRQGRFTSANRQLCVALEATEDQIVGKTNAELGFPKAQCDAWDILHQQVYDSNSPSLSETSTPMPDGSIHHYELNLNPLHDIKGNIIGVAGVTRDITDRKKAEEEKAKLEDQLRQSQKMEAVGRLAGGVAHDFNNLLTGITGYTEIIQASLDTGDPIYADMEEVRKAAERAAELTSQLLAFSRKQVIDPKVIQPNDILNNSQKMLQRIIGENINFVFEPAPKLWRIKADPGQLDQVFVNLAVNARDAMPDVGKLIIKTANVTLQDAPTIGTDTLTSGDFVMLCVKDNGHGMDTETLEHIFEPFYSTKEKDKGTGLGLATVYGIVKQNNGFISVDSKPKMGATFKIYFPAVTEQAQTFESKEIGTLPRGAETILLVEDEQMVRRLAKKVLESQGYNVIEQDSGGQALVYLDKNDDPVDLLLTDIVMPGMNGKELHDRIQLLRPKIKALFMSGYTEDIIAHHGILNKNTQFLAKPFNIKSLTRKVREVLDS